MLLVHAKFRESVIYLVWLVIVVRNSGVCDASASARMKKLPFFNRPYVLLAPNLVPTVVYLFKPFENCVLLCRLPMLTMYHLCSLLCTPLLCNALKSREQTLSSLTF